MSNKRYRDLSGRRFGSWVVVARVEPLDMWPKPRWHVQCDCGKAGQVFSSPLVGGRSKSCGCGPVGRPPRHGKYLSPEYKAWSSMWARCRDQNNASYPRYGGRGISVSDRWSDFAAFLSDVGARPSALHSLERVDNEGPYRPDNCKWATPTEQANNRSSTRRLTAFGETKPVSVWAKEVGIHGDTLLARVDRWGWDPERALTTPTLKPKVVTHE